ncbi:MAG: hypothetical protein U0903_10400 [Planctomycetales bacterium]
MSEAYILAAARTPIGKFLGGLSSPPLLNWGPSPSVKPWAANADPAAVEDVIMGNILAVGVGQALGATSGPQSGIP